MSSNPLEKFSTTLDNIDEKTRHYIFIGALLVLFILDYLILMGPQLSALMKISPQIKILSQNIGQTKNDVQRLDFYKSEVERLKGDIEALSQKVKSREDVASILEDISNVANINGVKIDHIMPETEEEELLLEKGKQKYYALPIRVEARSSYHDFGRFFNQIEKNSDYLYMEIFDIASQEESRLHKVNLMFKVIILDEEVLNE